MPRQKQSNPKPLKLQREEIKQLIKDGSSSGHQAQTADAADTVELPAKKKHHKHHHSKKKKPKYKSAMKVKIAEKVRNKRLAKALREKQVGKKKKKKKEMEMDNLSAVSNNNNNPNKGVSNVHVNQEVSNLIDGLSPDPDLMLQKDKYDLIKERSSRLQQAKKEKEKDTGSPVKKTPEKTARRTVSESASTNKQANPAKRSLDLEEVKDTKETKTALATKDIVLSKQSDSILPSEKSVSECDEDNVSKQHALEALLQITGVELNTMTKHQGPARQNPPVTTCVPQTTASTITTTVTTAAQHKPSGNIVKITETETGVVKYQLRNESLEEQGLKLVYTAQTTGQIDSDVLYSAYKPRKPGRPPADIDGREGKGKKPGRHVCQFCGRRCTKPSVLKKHIRSHTGERPYPCVPCGFWFKTKSNLYKHCKSHAHAIKAGLTPNSEDVGKVDFDEDNDSEETESEDEAQVCMAGMTPTSPGVSLGSSVPISSVGSEHSNVSLQEVSQSNAAQVIDSNDSMPKAKMERSELRQRLERRISLNALNECTSQQSPQPKLIVGNIPQTDQQQQRHSGDTVVVKEEPIEAPVVQASFALPAEITKSVDDVVLSASGPGTSDVLKSLLPSEVAGFRIDMETKRAVPVLSNQMSTTQSVPVLSTSTITLPTPSQNPPSTPGQLVIPVTGFNIVKSGGQFHVQIPVQGVPDEPLNGKDTGRDKPVETITVQTMADILPTAKPASKVSVQERIQQLITQNEAIVDKATLDSVKPRRTGLYRRDSTGTPPRLENAVGDVASGESRPASTGRDMPTLVKEGSISAQLQGLQGALFSIELPQKTDIQRNMENDTKIPHTPLVSVDQKPPVESNLLERVLKAPRTSQMPDLAPIPSFPITGFPGPPMGDKHHPVTSNELAMRVANGTSLRMPTGPYRHTESSSSSGGSNTIKNLLQDRKLRLAGMNPSGHGVPRGPVGESEAQYNHMWQLQAALQGKIPMSPRSNAIQMPLPGATVYVPGGPPGGTYPPQPYRGYPTAEDVQALEIAENRMINRRRKYKSESDAVTMGSPPKRRGRKHKREMPELALIGKGDSNPNIPEENTSGIPPPLGSPHVQLTNQGMLPFPIQGVPQQQASIGLLQMVPQSVGNPTDVKVPGSEVSVIQHTSVTPNQSKPDTTPLRSEAQLIHRQTPVLPWQPGMATQYLGHQVLPGPLSVQQYSPLQSRLMPPVSPQIPKCVSPSSALPASSTVQSQSATTPATSAQKPGETATTSECIPTAMQILAAVANHSFQAQSTASLPTQTLTVSSTSSGPVLSTGTSVVLPGNRPPMGPRPPLPGPRPPLPGPPGTLSIPSVHVRRPSIPDNASGLVLSQQPVRLSSPLPRSPQQKRVLDLGQLKPGEESSQRQEGNFENHNGSNPKRPKLDLPLTSVAEPAKKMPLKRPGALGGTMSRCHLTLDIPSPLTGSVTNSPKTSEASKASIKIDPKSLLTPEALSIASSVMRLASPTKPNTPSTPVDKARELGRLMAHAFHNAGGKVESLLTTTQGQVVLGPIATPTSTGSKQIFLLPSPSSSQPPTPFGSTAARSPRSPRTPAAPFPSKDTRVPVHRPRSTLPMARLTPHRLAVVFNSHLSDEHLMGMIKTNTPMPVTSSRCLSLQFASSSTRNQLLTQGTYCCLRRSQPMYVQQGSNMKISMYSNWKAGGNSQHPLGMSWKAHMALYSSSRNKKPRLYYITSDISPPKFGIVTQSGAWKPEHMTLKVETRQPDTPKPPLQTPDITSPVSEIGATSQLEQKTKDKKPKDHHYHKHDGHRIPIFKGGFKSNEDYEYVRGRGRGKYVCEECGIRCKKPSMLKKHIRTHTDMRPYQCSICNFAFKTKGNLTKHMKSKAHNKKCLENGITPGEGDLDQSYEDGDHQFSDADDENEDTDSAESDSEDESESGTPLSTCSSKDKSRMFIMPRERHSSVPNISELGNPKFSDNSCGSLTVVTQPASAGPLKRSFSEIFERPRRNSLPAGSSAFTGDDAALDSDRLDNLIGALKHRTDDHEGGTKDGNTSREHDKPVKLSRSEVVGKLSRHLTNRHQAQKAAAAAKDQPTCTSSMTFDISQLPSLHPGLLYPSTQPMSVQLSTAHTVKDKIRVSTAVSTTPQGPPVLDKLGHIAVLTPSFSMSSQYRLSTTIQNPVTTSSGETSAQSSDNPNVPSDTVTKTSVASSLPSTTTPMTVGAYIGSMVETSTPVFSPELRKVPTCIPAFPISIHKSPSSSDPPYGAAHFGVPRFSPAEGPVPRPQQLALNPTSHPDSLRLLTHAAAHQAGIRGAPSPQTYESQGSTDKTDINSFAASLAHSAYMQGRVTTPTPFAAQPLLTPLHLPPGTFNRDGSPRKVPPPVVEPISDDEDEHCNKRRRIQHPEKPVHLKTPSSRGWEPPPGNAIKQLLLARPQMWPGAEPLTPQSPFSSPFLPPSPSVTSIKTIPGPVAAMPSSQHLRPPLVSPILPSNLSQLPPTILSQIRSPTQLKSPACLPSTSPHSTPPPPDICAPFIPPIARAKTSAVEQRPQSSPKGKPESPALIEAHEEEINTSPPHGGNHKCSTCLKVFMKPNQLRIHMRTHLEEQTFRCHECSLEFRSRSLLAKHERSELHLSRVEAVELPVAGDTDPRPFKCKLCQIAFRIRGHLAKHLRSRGHIASLEREGQHPIVKQEHMMVESLSDDEGMPHSPASSDKTDSASECGDNLEIAEVPVSCSISNAATS